MADTLETLIRQMEALKRELEASRETTSLINASETLALIKRRIQQQRVDADGKRLGQYSTSVVPYFFYYNKPTLATNPEAKVQELYEKYGYFASYRDWKQVNSQSDPNINLTMTGRMMTSLRPTVIKRARGAVFITWFAQGQEEQDKFEFAVDRFPDAFRLSDDERSFIERANKKRIENEINKVFN